MSNEIVIRQPNDMYRRLNNAITGLEEHDDVEGAVKNIKAVMWRFDAVRDGAEFEDWLNSLFRFKSVRRASIRHNTVRIEAVVKNNGKTLIPGEVIEAIVTESPDSVELSSISTDEERHIEQDDEYVKTALIEVSYPSSWHIDRETIYHHNAGASEYRSGEKTYETTE